MDQKAIYQELKDKIFRHDRAYYVLESPTLSDQEYDRLLQTLRKFESYHPDMITSDSPTQRVGGEPIEGFEHVVHAMPMLSVDNTYSEDELRDFDNRVKKVLGQAFSYVVDPKIDGVAVSLRYEKGSLVMAVSRGDGKKGDNITHSAKTVASIPLRLHGKDIPDVLEVRGEIFWPWEAFNAFNEKLKKAGKDVFANPRNATSGTLKKLDARLIAGRGLQFLAHGLGQIEPSLCDATHLEFFRRLTNWGIPVSPELREYWTIEDVIKSISQWDKKRSSRTYETDGLVLKVNSFASRKFLGTTSRFPKWCIAYKFAAEQAESKLIRVDYQVGKTGVITPRAVMEPVQLAGTTVQHATLHNFDQIERLDVHLGDTVVVEKAGEIIPKISRVIKAKRPAGAIPVPRPTQCPVCNGSIEQDGVSLRCIDYNCSAQVKERLIHFVARDYMDIDGCGKAIIEALVDEGLVRDCADLYELEPFRDKMLKLAGMGKKSVTKLLEGLEASKKQPLNRLLAGLNIRQVGRSASEVLAEHFEIIENIQDAKASELCALDGIGSIQAENLKQFLNGTAGSELIHRLKLLGVNLRQPKQAVVANSPFSNKNVVVTGSLDMGRTKAHNLIRKLGGKPSSAVGKKTDLLVCGDSPGSKLAKANALGVQVMDEAAFLSIIGES